MTSDRAYPPGPEIRLRPFGREHLETTFEWLQDPGLRRDFMLAREIDWTGHQAWFNSLADDQTQVVFAIEADGLGHVGNAGVKNLEGSSGELWIYLRPGRARSQGIGTTACRELVRVLSQDLGLDLIYLHLAEANTPARRLYEKLGFVRTDLGSSSQWAGKRTGVIRMELDRPGPEQGIKLILGCYDAGGANSLTVLAHELGGEGFRMRTLAAGPAVDVFRHQGIEPDLALDRDMEPAEAAGILDQEKPDVLILGTSLRAMTERNLCQAARKQGVPTISLIDFWSNYALRFSTPGTTDLAFLPDRVACLDGFCRSGCVKAGIPEERLVVTGNPHWDHLADLPEDRKKSIRRNFRKAQGLAPGEPVVLIISSNLRNLEFDFGYGDEDIHRAVFSALGLGPSGHRTRVLVKPHPQEPRSELEEMIKGRGRVQEPDSPALEAVLGADLVIGSVSSLVHEAFLLGRRVISLQPAMFPGQGGTLGIFSRIGIPELASPRELEVLLSGLADTPIEESGVAPKPGQNRYIRAVPRIRGVIRKLAGKSRGMGPRKLPQINPPTAATGAVAR